MTLLFHFYHVKGEFMKDLLKDFKEKCDTAIQCMTSAVNKDQFTNINVHRTEKLLQIGVVSMNPQINNETFFAWIENDEIVWGRSKE